MLVIKRRVRTISKTNNFIGDNFDSYLNEDWERQETDWQSQYY